MKQSFLKPKKKKAFHCQQPFSDTTNKLPMIQADFSFLFFLFSSGQNNPPNNEGFDANDGNHNLVIRNINLSKVEKSDATVLPVLMIACDRVQVSRSLELLIK